MHPTRGLAVTACKQDDRAAHVQISMAVEKGKGGAAPARTHE
jgi:hypothetical protein